MFVIHSSLATDRKAHDLYNPRVFSFVHVCVCVCVHVCVCVCVCVCVRELPSWMCPKTCSLGWTLLCTVLSSSTQPTRCIFRGTQSRKPVWYERHRAQSTTCPTQTYTHTYTHTHTHTHSLVYTDLV